MRFKEATTLDQKRALWFVAKNDYGYPRALEPGELHQSWWFTYGPAIVWLCPYLESLQVHLAVNPKARSKYARFFLTGLVVIGQLLGFERLVWFGVPDDQVASYLRRLGWTEFDQGLEYPLDRQESQHGQGTEGAATDLPPPG